MVIGLTVVGLMAALLFLFRQIIGPLLLAFIIAFLFHPVAARLSSMTRLSWRGAVNLIYLLWVIVLLVLSTITGFAIVQQTQTLVDFVERFVNQLPELVADLSSRVYSIGPFYIDFSHYDLTTLANQLLNAVQPLLGRAGGLVSKFAASAATTLGWSLFVLLVSYFLLSEAGQFRERLVPIDIPGYNADMRRLGQELTIIWNSFLRGQLIISILVIIAYSLLLTVLGVRLTLAIAIMAGLARFIPWIGPLITWTVTGIVTFLMTGNYFNLEPWKYTLLVVLACLILDQIFDNLVVPRVMGQTLGVHPAGVLVAAPLLATLNLLGRYVLRKMLDLDPWPEPAKQPAPMVIPWARLMRRLRAWWHSLRSARRDSGSS
jgi:predicted PurR-regulated permease PerM